MSMSGDYTRGLEQQAGVFDPPEDEEEEEEEDESPVVG